MTGDQTGSSGRLRVAVIALEWPSAGRRAGGVGRYTKRLCEWLCSYVDLTVITGPAPVALEGDARLMAVDIDRPGGRFARYYLAPFRAARLVADFKPDVVHSHGDDWPLALRRRRPPIIRTYHGRSAAEARSGPLLRRANHYVLAGLESACRPRYEVAVGIGSDSVAGFRCHHLIPPVFGLGGKEAAAKDSEPLVVFVGGFASRKRGYLALDAVVEARQSVPELRFVVVGSTDDRRSYPAWVDYHAGIDDEAVRNLIGRAWVLLAPSTYEGFGIPAWEAMASGTAVLATPNPGMDYLSVGGSCCSVVGVGRLGEELVRLVRSDAARLEQVRKGLVRSEEVAKLGCPERYLELYHQVATRL